MKKNVPLSPHRATSAPPGAAPAGPRPPASGLVVTDVRDLLGEAREGILLLDGEPYRLRITARQKLILTK